MSIFFISQIYQLFERISFTKIKEHEETNRILELISLYILLQDINNLEKYYMECRYRFIKQQWQMRIQNISMSQTNGTIRIGSFTVDFSQVIGKGATGFVYKGFKVDTHEPVAVKAIKMSQVNNEVTQYLLDGQKKAMSTIKSPYVVKTHDIIQQADYCYIVMELCSNGTLKDHIQAKGKLSTQQATQMFRNIVIGYIAIVDALFIHRDLKTANILLRANGEPAIIDFGYCEMIMGKRPMIAYNVGSPSYMSPEAHSKSRYSQKSDIWSLGIILYEMLTGKTIDNGTNIKQFFKIIEAEGRVRYATQGMSPVCTELLGAALQVDPEKRATCHKLKYIIDKSMIPQMQAQLKKTQSSTQSSRPSSGQQLKFVPPAHFNYGPPTKSTNNIDKKQKISEHLKFLRGSDQFFRDGDKIQSVSTPPVNPNISYSSVQERNQHSVMFMGHPGQGMNPPAHHPAILRKSLQKNQGIPDQQRIMKKIMSVKDVIQNKPSFKKVPALHKANSLQPTHTATHIPSFLSRDHVFSMRII